MNLISEDKVKALYSEWHQAVITNNIERAREVRAMLTALLDRSNA